MSGSKISLVVTVAAAVILAAFLASQKQANARLVAQNRQLQEELGAIPQLKAEIERLSNVARAVPAPASGNNEEKRELMKLRGEVGALRQTANEAVAAAAAKEDPPSVMSGLTRSPEMVQALREQQKMGLGMLYKGFAERNNLPKETADNLNELLADHVMTNINHLTEILRGGKSPAEREAIFAAQEAETDRHVKELIGDEAFQKYKQYNSEMASYLTAEQFKGMMLKGEKETKDAQAKQLFALMQEETARALAAAGLPKDYQTVPVLNFRNIASEELAERNLQMLDSIYANVGSRAGSFLSPEELEKFAEFRKIAINNNRMALTMNRKIMAPPNK